MSVKTYNFLPDIFVHPETKKLGATYRPYVLVKLGYGKKWSKNYIRALVDSGADRNVFPASFASEIGMQYTAGKKHKIIGVGDQEVVSYIHMMKIKIETKEIDTLIEFGESIRIPLLGREGFFNYFDRITFNVKRKVMEIKF